ncbi:hypothetical protein OBBRIDRAFT_887537 [Obba rivulosa]|uniref:Uncharacterized protein n=1 Tax=Obba rivulosa TaxID=1052685 RepID=A0A8E2DKM7_9APHY|nr:hypothetical protein OBBRIDRAFT_887537 [Obba rivulosa]
MSVVQGILSGIDTTASLIDIGKFSWSMFTRHKDLFSTVNPQDGLDEISKIMTECQEFLDDMKNKDPLMGKIVERDHPGWRRKFRGSVRELRAKYKNCRNQLSKISKAKNKMSKKDYKVEWQDLIETVRDIREMARELDDDHLRTSAAAYSSSVYAKLKDACNRDVEDLHPAIIANLVESASIEEATIRVQSVAPSLTEDTPVVSTRSRRTSIASVRSAGTENIQIRDYPMRDLRRSDHPYD